MAVGFAMTDDGLYGGSPSELAFYLAMDTAFLPRAEDPARLRRVMADIALVDIDPIDLAAGQRLGFLDDLLQGMAIVWIAGERFGMEDARSGTVAPVAPRKSTERPPLARLLVVVSETLTPNS